MNYCFRFLSLILMVLSLGACVQFDDTSSLPDQIDGYSLILETPKFACYYDSQAPSEFTQLIKVVDLPDVDIFFSKNTSTRGDESKYDYKSLIIDQEGNSLTMFSSVNRFEGYYQLLFMIDDIESELIVSDDPEVSTRSPKNLGRDTMDCVVDAYGNHGWISVWITVQSAFIPQTAAAIAGACAIKNLIY